MSPSRRRLLHSAGVALAGAVAGCSGESGDDARRTETRTTAPATGTPSSTETPIRTPTASGTYVQGLGGPAAYPDRPDDITRSTATEYVEALEHARMENRMRTYGDYEVEDLSLTCGTVYDRAAHGGHYVLASCRGYANYEDGTHADWGHSQGFYFVAPGLTVGRGDPRSEHRDCEAVFAAGEDGENFATPCDERAAGYRVYGFHPGPHDLTVTVEFLGEDTEAGSSELAFEREYTIGASSGIEQHGVTYRRGEYRLTAALDAGPEATFDWDLSTSPGPDTPPVSVLVTPAEGIRIRRVPFPEILPP